MIRTIGDSGINWNWYLCADFNETDKTVHIFYYQRWHKYEERDSKHPKAEWLKSFWKPFEFLEDSNRVVYGLKLGNEEYLVTNPDYIFNYKDMSHYVSE